MKKHGLKFSPGLTLIGVLATGLGSFWLLNKFLFRKCVGNSMENMLTDVRVLRVNVMDCTCIDHRRPSPAKRELASKRVLFRSCRGFIEWWYWRWWNKFFVWRDKQVPQTRWIYSRSGYRPHYMVCDQF